MNILSFDIEEWSLNKDFYGNDPIKYVEYDRILNHILELLYEYNISATFFCLGKIATDFPHVINKIASYGHEIGCHSYAHRWVNKMTRTEFAQDTHVALAAIEDLTGKKVVSYRAPAFSIGESNKWAFEVLAENGILNDASIFPGIRDFGGFPNFTEHKPCRIDCNGVLINEFPIPLYKIPIIGKELAYSGGGYFRLMPLKFVKKQMLKSSYNMCYFHIEDLLTNKATFMSRKEYEEYFNEKGSLHKRLIRFVKANVGRESALMNLESLIKGFKFYSIIEYNRHNSFTTILSI